MTWTYFALIGYAAHVMSEADEHAGFGRFMRYAVPVTTVIAIAAELLGLLKP